MTDRKRVVGQWREHINAMGNALKDFERALPCVTTDAEFVAAYAHLSKMCGDVLAGIRLPTGTVDDLRAAVTGKEVRDDQS